MAPSLAQLRTAVERDAAIRRVRRLQPAGGPGDKLFPPTYPGGGADPAPRHATETRRIGGVSVPCVLIDSVQSQANRMEEALLAAARAGRIAVPMFSVEFQGTGVPEIGSVTSLDAPHRVFDAILRDSMLGGDRFKDSAPGRALLQANMRRATAVFETAPTALIFGAWNSTGEGGGLGAKFPRCVVSEIVGIGVEGGIRTGSRIDPIGIRKQVEIYQVGTEWFTDPKAAEEHAKKIGGNKPAKVEKRRPSEINHGNIAPTISSLGVTIDYAQHTAVISLAGLRRLAFPAAGAAESTRDRDLAARAVLAALSLVALCEQDRAGYALRSRCDLVPEPDGDSGLQLVHADGTVEALAVDAEGARTLLGEAVAAAKDEGLAWSEPPIRLTPHPRLVQIIQSSRELALADASVPELDDR